VRGYRQGENPARWKGHLDKLLPKRRKVKAVKHHSAIPYSEMPAFMAGLRQRDSISARALEFTILTAARTGEVIGGTWDEINLTEAVWTIPASRMKAGKEHRVPLSARTVELLEALPKIEGNPYLFPSARHGGPLSNMAMLELMRGILPGQGYVPHGFRSTFRDWAAEQTAYPNHVLEQALAHQIGNAVEVAYRRSDLLDKRKRLMADWADYCASPPKKATSSRSGDGSHEGPRLLAGSPRLSEGQRG
jgi:integrase